MRHIMRERAPLANQPNGQGRFGRPAQGRAAI